MRAATSLCACGYTLFVTELMGGLLLLAMLLLLSFYRIFVWGWKEQSLQVPMRYRATRRGHSSVYFTSWWLLGF